MATAINRRVAVQTVTTTTAIGTTEAIPFEEYDLLEIHVPVSTVSVTYTFWTSPDNVTYLAHHDAAGNATTQTVAASKAYQFDTALAGAAFIKIVTNADDSTRPITVVKK